MKKLRAVSLFSNCGAGDLGYREAGFQFEVMAELDPRRLQVSLLNHPGAVGVVGDLRETWETVVRKYRSKARDVRPALLSACPPCQGMSSARSGKGSHDDADAGSKDERNLLVTVIAKVAKELQPAIIVVENVPAFFSRKVHHPSDKKPVSAANYLIADLAKEYFAFPIVTDLADFGVPQSRNRAFLTLVRKDIAALKSMRANGQAPFPKPSHYDNGGLPPVTLTQALSGFQLPDLDAASSESAASPIYNGMHSVPVWSKKIYAMVAAIPKGLGNSAWENDQCATCGTVDVNLSDVYCPKCGDPLLRPIVQEADGSYRLIKGFKSSYRRMHAERPAATVTTASGHIGSDYTIHPTQNRLLSPLECSLLQTFPANFEWGDALQKQGSTHVREMIGEAVPPAFTKLHGEILVSLLRRQRSEISMSIGDERIRKGWRKLAAAAKKDGRPDPKTYGSDLELKLTAVKRSKKQPSKAKERRSLLRCNNSQC